VGVEAAAEIYFSKNADELTLDEAALLAGLPQAPSEYSPFKNPQAALSRRNEVLRAMVKSRYITATQADEASQKKVRLRPGNRYFKRKEPFFFDYVSDVLIERYGINAFRRGGLKIHTTINPKFQESARNAIAGQLNVPGDPSSAIVSIDPRNGYIRAMASSGTYKDRVFNLAAQGHRQPGSSFKTFVLTTAIKRGVNPASTSYVSKPLALDLGYGQTWKVKTYDNSYAGRINLVSATLKSDNSVYAQLDMDLGAKNVAETAKEMGITTKLDGLPAEGLGGLRLGVSPLEMASAYATLASGGVYHKPNAIKRVDFPDGKSENLGKSEGKRVLTDGQAYEVTKILKMNVMEQGTGLAANPGCPAAGKTGTTDNFTDAWFVGYTPRLSSAVWVGYPKSNAIQMRSVHGITVAGGTFPAQIWHDYMVVAKGGYCEDFPQPATPVVFTPWYGKYSKEAAQTDYTNPYGTFPNDTKKDKKKDNQKSGGKKYDPRLYEAPPQQPPNTAPPPPSGNGQDQGNQAAPGGGATPPPTTGTG
jgi:penicillin-binding protein 1A